MPYRSTGRQVPPRLTFPQAFRTIAFNNREVEASLDNIVEHALDRVRASGKQADEPDVRRTSWMLVLFGFLSH